MNRKKVGIHRMRGQIIRKLILSFVISAVVLIIGTIAIYAVTSDGVAAIEFAKYVAEDASSEIDNIEDIEQWSGWEQMNDEWKVTVVDSDGYPVYANNTNLIMPSLWITNEMEIEDLGGKVIINSITGEKTQIYIDIFSVVDWFLFFILFAWMFRKTEKYTYEIADGIDVIAGGEMNHRIPIKGKNELTMIAANINGMAEALQDRMEEKERSDKERDDLITNLAHDVRTSITILEGYLSMLIDGKDISKEKEKEYLNIALGKCQELSNRADNLFEYVRLNNKREQLKYSRIQAKSYIYEKFEEMTMILVREGFEFQVDVKLNEKRDMEIDKTVTQRVFDNMLSNIIKYADKKYPVELKAFTKDEDIVVTVKNKSKDKITIEPQRLFERTVSGDLSRNGKSEGLGLSICKLIMEMQGGKIQVDIDEDDILFSLHFLT